jgi:hypothetical protein
MRRPGAGERPVTRGGVSKLAQIRAFSLPCGGRASIYGAAQEHRPDEHLVSSSDVILHAVSSEPGGRRSFEDSLCAARVK